MQQVAATMLLLCYLGLGSGAVERWHNAQHAAEDAKAAIAAQRAGMPLDHLPFHSDQNCAFHWQLHLATMAVAWVPLLICLGLLVAFLSELPRRRVAFQRAVVITCRGPPHSHL